MRERCARGAGLLLIASMIASLSTSCIYEGFGFVTADIDPTATEASFIESEDGLRIRISLDPEIQSDGTVLLDSALVVVSEENAVTSFPDPDIETSGFPVSEYGRAKITLEVPSPISDITSFDAFCDANGRRADITLRFFSTSIDPEPGEPPPVTEVPTSVILRPSGAPKPPDVIGIDGMDSIATSDNAQVENLTPGPDGTILFVVSEAIGSSFTGFRADAEARDTIDVSRWSAPPRLASDDIDVLYIGGSADASLHFRRQAPEEGAEFDVGREDTSPQYRSFNVVAMEPTATGVRAAVISSYPLLHPAITSAADGTPPDDKFYGSFIVDASYAAGTLDATAVTQIDREIVEWLPLTDGVIELSGELPPRSPDTTLRVQRLDAAGAVVWSHEEPVSAVRVDADTMADGSVLVAYELPTGSSEVLRLRASDGSELARAKLAGTRPTVAAYGADHAMLSFNGVAPFDGVVAPTRAVPLLLELDADMGVVRGVQLACAGRAGLKRSRDGALFLLGIFGQRFTLGDFVTNVTPDTLILTRIADPL